MVGRMRPGRVLGRATRPRPPSWAHQVRRHPTRRLGTRRLQKSVPCNSFDPWFLIQAPTSCMFTPTQIQSLPPTLWLSPPQETRCGSARR